LFEFKRHQPGQECCRIELTDNGFDIGQAARQRMQRDDVAVANRGEPYEAEIDQIAGNGEVVLERWKSRKCIRRQQRHETEQRHKNQSNNEIQQNPRRGAFH